jgi:hypothetical protein
VPVKREAFPKEPIFLKGSLGDARECLDISFATKFPFRGCVFRFHAYKGKRGKTDETAKTSQLWQPKRGYLWFSLLLLPEETHFGV